LQDFANLSLASFAVKPFPDLAELGTLAGFVFSSITSLVK
jgi:hypothetical protein